MRYRMKVRKTTYLWGGENIPPASALDSGLYLWFRVDETGEPLRFGIRKTSLTELGILKPGESYCVRLKGITGVYAFLDDPLDSFVDCQIIFPPEI